MDAAAHNSAAVRIAYAAAPQLRAKASWALAELMVRARVREWKLADDAGEQDADLTLPHDPRAWEFAADAAPDPAADPLACTFWWLARVEELLAPANAFDEHGRFRWEASLLARLEDPLAAPVDELAERLAAGPLAPWVVPRAADEPAWRLVPTHDIDLPWRWTRTGTRRALRAARDAVRRGRILAALRELGALVTRPAWLLARTDPWHNARRITRLEQRLGARSTSYHLVARTAPEDGEAALDARGATYAAALPDGWSGLHGSYVTSEQPDQLAIERARLQERLPGQAITDHRFHYLRHRPVDAWPHLAAAGFRTDASLGYAERPGFRAGTTHPFRAWSHADDAPLDLLVIPLALMDASFDERYLNVRSRSARRRIATEVLDRIARHGGCASLLVHNDRLCNGASDGWTALYRHLLRHVRDTGGAAITAGEAVASRTRPTL